MCVNYSLFFCVGEIVYPIWAHSILNFSANNLGGYLLNFVNFHNALLVWVLPANQQIKLTERAVILFNYGTLPQLICNR
jgi:hypothetical protein